MRLVPAWWALADVQQAHEFAQAGRVPFGHELEFRASPIGMIDRVISNCSLRFDSQK